MSRKFWEPETPGTLRGLSRPVMGLLYLLHVLDYHQSIIRSIIS
jgi:hypothetical protein